MYNHFGSSLSITRNFFSCEQCGPWASCHLFVIVRTIPICLYVTVLYDFLCSSNLEASYVVSFLKVSMYKYHFVYLIKLMNFFFFYYVHIISKLLWEKRLFSMSILKDKYKFYIIKPPLSFHLKAYLYIYIKGFEKTLMLFFW